MSARMLTVLLAASASIVGCLEPLPEVEEREIEVPTLPRVDLPPSCGILTLRAEPVIIRDEPAIIEARFGGCDERDLVIGQASCERPEDHFDVTVEVNASAWRITNGSARAPTSSCIASAPSEYTLRKGEWLAARVEWNASLLTEASEKRVPPGDYVLSAWLVVEGRVFLEHTNATVI